MALYFFFGPVSVIELSEHEIDLMNHPSCMDVSSLIDVPGLLGKPLSKHTEANISGYVANKLLADL